MPAPTPAVTLSVTLDTPPDEVYAYIVDPRNLPVWAAGLAPSVELRGGAWCIDTPSGPWTIAFAEHNAFRVADHVVTQPDGTRQLNPMRVLPNGLGSEVTFTVFRGEVSTDEEWASLQHTIQADLDALGPALQRRTHPPV
ncbi:MAG: SRPBCC family protein [Solirubrobacteraceae bacterium]|nr:SRPBCC family protein [Solirubrobacteraceae bacterium]